MPDPSPFIADGPAPPAVPVSALNRLVRETLERSFPLMWVSGEISNLTRAASGHLYFTLKDAQAQVRCTMWRNRAQLLPFQAENGMRVEARALVTLYEARGDYQLAVETLRRAGSGSLFEAFIRLKERLAAEGLFDPAGKRPLPRFPHAVGVVTSPAAAALRDVLAALRRRAPHLPVVIYPAPVQGSEAGAALARAVRTAGERAERDGIELILLVRGGGSMEDLWAFNDESLARAIRACPVPVVCGVGHETDFTIADFAADQRATTPTMAAELASAGFHAIRGELATRQALLGRALQRRIEGLAQRLDRAQLRLLHPRERLRRAAQESTLLGRRLDAALRLRMDREGNRLARLALRLRARRPALDARHQALARWAQGLERAVESMLEARRHQLAALSSHLQHLDPQAVLARGYSITRDARGVILRSSAAVREDDAIAVQLADGSLHARVVKRAS